jgi:hypothetical protein
MMAGKKLGIAILLIVGFLLFLSSYSDYKRSTSPQKTSRATESPLAEQSNEIDRERAAFLKNPHLSETKRGRVAKEACESSILLSVNQCLMIADHQVWVGMTEHQAILAWGKPDHINDSSYKSGAEEEQWVYGNSYVYIEDGRVSAIQRSR